MCTTFFLLNMHKKHYMVKGYGKITSLVKFDKTFCKYCRIQIVNDTDEFTSNQNAPTKR